MEEPVLDAILERRSVRKFKDKHVSEEDIEKILEAARWAPSGKNNQPWRFQIIRNEDLKADLAECTHYSKTFKQADVLLAIYLDKESTYDRTKDLQSIGACCQNVWLAIHALGLGGVWNGEILNHRKCARDILKIPNNLELMAIFCIGHPAESPSSNRAPLEELIVKD